MEARRRSTIILLLVAIIAFAIRWPLDSYICDPAKWPYRPPAKEGEAMMKSVFTGGAGTPAIYAMLGGQRYLVANILWTYSDVLFHQGHPEKMPAPLESTVTLNPSFLEAWSVYGWHMAWNMNTYTTDLVQKQKYLVDGEEIYKRAIIANPDKPRPYFDISWLYIQRMGRYDLAQSYLEAVVYNTGKITMNGEELDVPKGFKPFTKQEISNFKAGLITDTEVLDRKWLPSVYSNRLAYVYRKIGVIRAIDAFDARAAGKTDLAAKLFKEAWDYQQKAIKVYEDAFKLDDTDEAAPTNAQDLKNHIGDEPWLKKQVEDEIKHRGTYGMGESPSSAIYGAQHSR